MSGESDEPSVWETVTKLLSQFNKVLRENVMEYNLTKTYGLFLGLSFILAISIGAVSSSILMTGYDSAYFIMFFILTIIMSPISLFICGYIIVPIYGGTYENEETVKTLLAYQILNALLGVLLFFYFKSDVIIYSSWAVFLILGFIHPVSKYIFNVDTSLDEIKNTLNKVYIIITILHTVLSIIFKYINLFS